MITKKIVDTLEDQKNKYAEEDVNRKSGLGAGAPPPPPPPGGGGDDDDGGGERVEEIEGGDSDGVMDEDGAHLV